MTASLCYEQRKRRRPTDAALCLKNKAISFELKINFQLVLHITHLVNNALWMWESGIDSRSGGEYSLLKTNATGECWHIIQHKTNEYVRQQVNILARRQEFTVNRKKLSWFGHVCRYDMLLKIILQGTVDGRRRKGRPRKSRNGHQGMDRPDDVIITAHCGLQQSMGSHHSGGIGRSIPTTLGHQGY